MLEGTGEAPSLTLLIKSVARTLSTPYKAGVYVSIADLVEVARKIQVPVAVKESREWILEELLKTAVDYGKLEDIVEELKVMVELKLNALKELLKDYPQASDLYLEYFENAGKTLERLRELRDVYVKYYKASMSE